MKKLEHYLENAAWLAVSALLIIFTFFCLFLTSELRSPETIRYVFGNLIPNMLIFAAMLGAVWILKTLLVKHKSLIVIMLTALTILSALLLLGFGTSQEVDFLYVCQAAEAFSSGNYSPMSGYYLNEHSYQLGTVILFEGILRLFPGANISLVMQALNTLLSVGTAVILARLGNLVFGRHQSHTSSIALFMLCLPMFFYNLHVYGTLPILFLSSASMLCLVRFIQTNRLPFGLGYVLCISLAYMIKPNSAIALIALFICAMLTAMKQRRFLPLIFALLSVLMAIGFARFAIWQYEYRSGVRLREDVSMLSRLVMGLQDGSRAAGWYNSYIEQFFDSAVTMEQEKTIAVQDLNARLNELIADPVRACIFFVQKAFSQWLEPTYGTLLYGNYCQQRGMLASAAQAIFSENSALRLALEFIMKGWQQMLYALSCLGTLSLIRKERGPESLILPVTVLGGFLYHILFEAKSQYIYVYAIYLVPLAGYGLSVAECFIRSRLQKIKTREKPTGS